MSAQVNGLGNSIFVSAKPQRGEPKWLNPKAFGPPRWGLRKIEFHESQGCALG
jgi:hypothetical protein